jgi:uncharacterized membrane protein YqjE
MTDGNSKPPGIGELARKLVVTGFAALQNRSELLQIELQEEKNRVVELFIWAGAVCILGMLFLLVLTATIILCASPEYRLWVAIAFCAIYLAGAVLAFLNLKALIKSASLPLAETMAEVRKDREWLESLK